MGRTRQSRPAEGQSRAERRRALEERAEGRAGASEGINSQSNTGFCSDPELFTSGIYLHSRFFFTCLQQRAAELPNCAYYNVINLFLSILTADCSGNVQRRGGKTAGKQTLVSAEFKHKHTDTHPHTQECLPLLARSY